MMNGGFYFGKIRRGDKHAYQSKILGREADARGGEGAPPGLAAIFELLARCALPALA